MTDLQDETRVMDASALLALAHGEPGSDMVKARLEFSIVSAVNWSEVVQKSLSRGANVDGLREEFVDLGLTIQPFGAPEAEEAAAMWAETRSSGLSLAARACLSLARSRGLPVLTADQAWVSLSLGVTIELIR